MDFNILAGGAAGQGVETVSAVLEKILKRKGYQVFAIKDYMSRVRGGHNFSQIRFDSRQITSHRDDIDVIIAMNGETIDYHIGRLKADGFVICDEDTQYDDDRVIRLPLKKTASASGNPRTIGSVAIGSLLELIGIEKDDSDNIFNEFFNEKVAAQNAAALNEGRKLTGKRYSVTPVEKDSSILINGNQAIALGALAAGCRFYSAYPMTPSTTIMNYLASKMNDAEIVVEQAEDEIAAINMAIGASYAGARSMTGTSGGGFSLMVEALGLSGMMEVPLVIAEVQRPGPVTGLPTRTEQSDLRFLISASQGEFPRMIIALRDPEDAFYQTVRAFNLADKYQIPVILLSDQYLADTNVTVKPFDFDGIRNNQYLSNEDYSENNLYKRYKLTSDGISPRVIPGKLPGVTVLVDSDEHDEYGHITESADMRNRMVLKRLKKLELLKDELQEPIYFGEDDCEVLLLAWGSLKGPVNEAVEMLNKCGSKRYGALVFGDIWPLPVKTLKEKAVKAGKIINVEQNATGQLASVIAEVAGIFCSSSVLKFDGRPISAQEIYSKIKGAECNE